MRILFVSRWYPYPPTNGSKIRIFNLLAGLGARHEVTLLSFIDPADETGGAVPHRLAGVKTIPWRRRQPSLSVALLRALGGRPRSQYDAWDDEMAREIGRACASGSFDVIVTSQMDTAAYAPARSATPVVFEEAEIGAILAKGEAARTALGRLRHRLTWWKLRRYVRATLPRFAAVTVVSGVERELLRGCAPNYQPVFTVPNGVDLPPEIRPTGGANGQTLVYSGSLTYEANLDAMEWFLDESYSLLKRAFPAIRLVITGSTAGVPLDRLRLDGSVRLTGHVDDVRTVVRESAVAVVPLRLGGGTRLKILEAMAVGTPVVSTRKGAEGLDVVDGEHLLLADDPAAFATRVGEVLRDRELSGRLARAGRDLVERRYNWRAIGEQLDSVLCRVTERGDILDQPARRSG
jgi:polysaccharide biosynthesis protein PslH